MAKKSITKTPNPEPPPVHLLLKPKKEPSTPPLTDGENEEATASPLPSPSVAASEKQGSPPLPTSTMEESGEPPVVKSVNALFGLSSALSAFRRRWEDLQNHFDSIQKAIDSRSKQINTNPVVSPKEQQLNTNPVVSPKEQPLDTNPVVSPKEQVQQQHIPVTKASPDLPIRVKDSTQESPNHQDDSRSDLEKICDTMAGRSLRRYIISNLADIAKLRESVPAALKRAPNPAKLVLDCVGRFYLQGSKAYTKHSPMTANRQASLLVLEFFLLTGCCSVVEFTVKEEAKAAAIAWRNRLIHEGALSKANCLDARGLLLFVGCYGIPSIFEIDDLIDLIWLSNPREICDALRQSNILLGKIPDITSNMVKNGSFAEAIDAVCIFGVEDKFSKTIVTSFLRECRDAWKSAKKEAHGSFVQMKEANEKRLASLKAVVKCLEGHKLDVGKLIPWDIMGDIRMLEKENEALDEKIEEKVNKKRKSDEIEFRTQESKRPWPPTTVVSPHPHEPSMMPLLSQEKRSDVMKLYDGSMSNNFANSGFPGLLNGGYSVPNGSGSMVPNLNMSVGGVGASSTASVFTGGFAGVEPMMHMHNTNTSVGQYGWHPPNFTAMDKAPYVEQKPFVGLPNTPSLGTSGSSLYNFADSVFDP